jgi:hypothetical protein
MNYLSRLFSIVITAAGVCVLGFIGYRIVRSDLAASVYRQRLSGLTKDYEQLKTSYNEAVKRTAVSELVVNKGKLSVRIRDVAGTVKEIPTDCDPAREVFVDYVLVDSRLWIRRVFDSHTAPEKAVVIDPQLAHIDFNDPKVAHGKAIYRTLGEGRWVISVSGDGSLTLAKAQGETELASAPVVKDYGALEHETDREAEAIGPKDVWNYLTGG